MLLAEKTAVVTGCNRGIGAAIVGVFARHGANVCACVRKPNEGFEEYASELARETGVRISPVYFDLEDSEGVKAGVREVASAHEAVDILVNNAGVMHSSLFQMTPVNKVRAVFEANFFGQVLLSQYITRMMARRRSGSVINISSSAAIEGNEGRTAYAASKAALISVTKVMARELAQYGIRVNAVAPGLTATDMMRESTPEDALKATLERTCMRRAGTPEEIANSVLFLASDLASYVTGQVLRVDGGM